MTKVYKNNFIFIANRFEEWQGGRCISQGPIETKIVAEVSGNNVHFELHNISNLRIVKSFDFEIFSADHCILLDRIQYINAALDFTPIVPMVCNLFYDGNNIKYIRFAMTNPDRLIEFYGYMSELGQPAKGMHNNISASSIIDELSSFGMLNADALMERAVKIFNQVNDVRDDGAATKILESLKLFVKAYKLNEEEYENNERNANMLKPKILEFISLCNYKLGNFNNAYCIAKQGLKAIDEAVENSALIGLPREAFGERNMNDVINVIEQKYFGQVFDENDIWNVDPTVIETEQYEKFISSQQSEISSKGLSKANIEDLVKTIREIQSIFNEYGNKTGNVDMFITANGLELFLNPLYYAWEKLKYGRHTDFMKEGDTLFGYMMFELDVYKNVQNVIKCLEDGSPFAKIEIEGKITNALLNAYNTIIEKIDSGEF